MLKVTTAGGPDLDKTSVTVSPNKRPMEPDLSQTGEMGGAWWGSGWDGAAMFTMSLRGESGGASLES